MYKVTNSERVKKCLQNLSSKTAWKFEQQLNQLREDGYLPEETPIAASDHLFRFRVDNDWVATAQRPETRTFLGRRTWEIEILELVSQPQKPSQSLPSKAWIKEATQAIIALIRPYLPSILGVITLGTIGAIAISAVADNNQGQVDIKLETDGRKINGEVNYDSRQLK